LPSFFLIIVMADLQGAKDLAEYIVQNYSGRVVEVGVGYNADVARHLQYMDPSLELRITDRVGRTVQGLQVEADDIFSPRLEQYLGARLLYSLRPPLEMQLAIGELAAQIGADVLIRPLGDEVAELPGFQRKLINAGQARFYLFRPDFLPLDL
jgi:uncharacterized UPF0146 family protein